MLTLPTNTANFIGRFFFLAFTFIIGYLFINFGLKEANKGPVLFRITVIHLDFKAIYLMYFLIIIVGFLAFTIIDSLLSINQIQIDTVANIITFIKPLDKQTIATDDIKEYFETVHKNAFKSWTGLLIKTNDNKTIQVAGQNVKSLPHFKDYLKQKNIHYAGQKRMKYPFN
jgi:hypothetical protein